MSIAKSNSSKHPNNLQALRKACGLTQNQVAARMSLDQTTYYRYEAGERRIKADQLQKFAEIFGVNQWDILPAGDAMDEQQRALIRMFSQLAEDKRKTVMDVVRSMQAAADLAAASAPEKADLDAEIARHGQPVSEEGKKALAQEVSRYISDIIEKDGIDGLLRFRSKRRAPPRVG